MKHNKYFIESSHPDTLQFLLKDSVIREARVVPPLPGAEANAVTGVAGLTISKAPTRGTLVIPGTANKPADETDARKQADADLFTSVVGVDMGE